MRNPTHLLLCLTLTLLSTGCSTPTPWLSADIDWKTPQVVVKIRNDHPQAKEFYIHPKAFQFEVFTDEFPWVSTIFNDPLILVTLKNPKPSQIYDELHVKKIKPGATHTLNLPIPVFAKTVFVNESKASDAGPSTLAWINDRNPSATPLAEGGLVMKYNVGGLFWDPEKKEITTNPCWTGSATFRFPQRIKLIKHPIKQPNTAHPSQKP